MDNTLDAGAQAAIDELASQLTPTLGLVVDAAIREALCRIDAILQARRGEIEASTDRVDEILHELGDEMKAKAATALTEGIRNRVIPAIQTESLRITKNIEQLLRPQLESTVQETAAVGATVKEAETRLAITIDTAIREALGGIDSTLQARRGEIEASTDRVDEILHELGDEMKAKAATALTEGIQNRVIPAIQTESQRVAETTEQLLEPRLESVAQATAAVGATVKEVEIRLATTIDRDHISTIGTLAETQQSLVTLIDSSAKESTAAASAVIAQVGNQVEELTRTVLEHTRMLAADGENAKITLLSDAEVRQRTLSQQLQMESKQLGRENKEIGEKLLEAIAQGTRAFQQGIDTLSRKLSAFQNDMKQATDRQGVWHKDGVDLLNKVILEHRRTSRRLFVGQLLIAVISLAIFIVLFIFYK